MNSGIARMVLRAALHYPCVAITQACKAIGKLNLFFPDKGHADVQDDMEPTR
jgi:hypothetical protein